MSRKGIIRSNGVVCFLDLLGAKGGWRDAENMIDRWDKLFDKLNDLALWLKDKHNTDTAVYSFSDTIVLTAPFNQLDKSEAFNNLAGIIAAMLPDFFAQKLLLRGCITVGDYYTSQTRRMLIGPTIDEAIQYYAMAEWAGVSLAPSAHLFSVENPTTSAYWALIKYPIPLKGGIESDGIAVNWPIFEKSDTTSKRREILIEELKNSIDVSVSLKLRNTINFVDYAMKKNENQPSHADQ